MPPISFCLMSQAVSYLTPSWRISSIAAMSFLALAIRCVARSHLVSGVFDLWKSVPARADVCLRQAEHWKMRRALLKLWTVPPQSGHTKPSGQRIVTRAAWHCRRCRTAS